MLDEIKGGLILLNNIKDTLTSANAYAGNKSLIDVGKVARVEPLVIVDTDVANVDMLPSVMQSLLSVFSAYYLQAAELLGTKIDGVSIAKKLAPLNPNQSLSDILDSGAVFANEELKYSLLPHKHRSISIENDDNKKKQKQEPINKDEFSAVQNMKKTTSVDLSVGNIYTVKFSSQNAKGEDVFVKTNIAIRLMANYISSSNIVNIITSKDGFDLDLKERFHSWRAGRLDFIKDLILCNDLIDKHKKSLLKDNSGVYNQIMKKEFGVKASAILRGTPSYAVASNIAIMSSDTISAAEAKMYGKIKDYKFRKNLFQNTNLMILAVIDKQWERVTFYYRNMEEFTVLSSKDLAQAKNSDGNSVNEILKSFITGSMGTAI